MQIIPFEFQNKAVASIVDSYSKGVRGVVLNSAPSSGKTVMASMLIQELQTTILLNKKVWFFVHLDELFNSTIKALQPFFRARDINAIYKGSKPRKDAKIHICMVQTFASRIKNKGWGEFLNDNEVGLCIFDECHRGEHDHVIEYVLNNTKEIRLAGLSGTPKKPKGAKLPLGIAYQEMVYTVSELELIAMERTNPPYIIRPDHEDDLHLEQVEIQNSGFDKGEYKTNALSSHMMKRNIYDFVGAWQHHANNTKTLVFCVDIKHTVYVCNRLNDLGIKAKFVTSEMQQPKKPNPSSKEYEKKMLEYADKLEHYNAYKEAVEKGYTGSKHHVLRAWGTEFYMLINAGIFTTGFDDDEIKSIVLLRPTTSENLFLQMVARGKRFKEGKGFYFLFDFAGNIKKFGLPLAERRYSLAEVQGKSKDKKGDAPTKICPVCGQSVPASERYCPAPKYEGFKFIGICGHKFAYHRPERESGFKLETFEEIIGHNPGFAKAKFKHNKKTTVSDVYEYYLSKRNAGYEINYRWLIYTLYELFGRDGLIEFAESTGRNVDDFLYNVQREFNSLHVIELNNALAEAPPVPEVPR